MVTIKKDKIMVRCEDVQFVEEDWGHVPENTIEEILHLFYSCPYSIKELSIRFNLPKPLVLRIISTAASLRA